MTAAVADPFVIAVEHIAWCISQRMAPADFFAAVHRPLPALVNWQAAIWCAADLASQMSMSTAYRVTVYPPFRAPAAPKRRDLPVERIETWATA